MARRSSARLRGREPSTPKRVSLSHDAPIRTPRTAPVKMPALEENDEMPGAFPRSASPAQREMPVKRGSTTSNVNLTPKNSTPIKPTSEEMHPAQYRQSTAKPLEEARWLGFSNMPSHTEPTKSSSHIPLAQATPTRVSQASGNVDSPKHQFSFKREHSLELSPAAKRLMEEKREEAAKIREEMLASGEGVRDIAAVLGRRIATPKGRKGRFSEVHTEEFMKMESIANHPSAFRAAPKIAPSAITPVRVQTESQRAQQHHTPSPTKSLKRSPSRAELDGSPLVQQSTLPRSSSKPLFGHPCQQTIRYLPTSTYHEALPINSGLELSSPVKRAKRSATEDVSVARSSSGHADKPLPSTTRSKKGFAPLDISTLASPTEASLMRAASVKSTATSKIPAPALTPLPSKPNLHATVQQSPLASTPLLARSASKASLFTRQTTEASEDDTTAPGSPLLSRSPLKGSIMKPPGASKTQADPKSTIGALLSRSPLKASLAKCTKSERTEIVPAPSTPLLARSPVKIVLPESDVDELSTKIPSKSTGGNLLGRFNLLRASPMKSILRSPQRLYSDDPAKVAAGTHLATPPKHIASKGKHATTNAASMTAPVSKRVDFSSSTKDRYERAQSELSSTPSKEKATTPDPIARYPSLPSLVMTTSTPTSRRQTVAPSNFTFRAGEHNIVFGQSPNPPPSSGSAKRLVTIRHVSAEPELPSAPMIIPASMMKKRKFEFENHAAAAPAKLQPAPAPMIVAPTTTKKRKFNYENETAADDAATEMVSDKENNGNEEAERPAKRVKSGSQNVCPPKQATRRPTLGVKPKTGEDGKGKKPSTVSRARLNALSQPKRRT